MISTHLTKEELARKLRESEENLKAYVEDAPDGIYLADLKGTFLYGNKQAEEITGYTKQELLGKSFLNLNLLPLKYLPKAIKLLTLNAAGKTTGPDTFELVRKDGRKIWIEIKTKPIEQFGKTVVIGFVRDIAERKQADAAMSEKNELLSLFIKQSPVCVYIKEVTPHKSRVMMASESFQDMIGIAGSNMGGMTMEELFPAEFAAKITADDWAVVSGGKMLKLDEDLNGRNYTTVKFPIFHQGRNLLAGYSMDITLRKQAEEALRESTESYRSLFKNMINGYAFCKILVDEENKPVDFLYIDVNEAFEKLTGLKKEDVIGKKVTEAIPSIKASNPELIPIYGEVAATGKPTAFEVLIKSLDIWLAISVYSPRKDYFVAVFDNITERKKAEQSLASSERKYRQLIENMHEGIWTIDKDACTSWVNSRMAEILGYTVDEMQGKHLFSFMDEHGVEIAKRLLERRSQGITEQHDFEFMRKDGRRVYLIMETSPITDANGNYVGALACVTDITERKQNEEQLKIKESAITSSINAIAHADMQGNITYVNPSFLKMWGYEKNEEVMGRPVADFWQTSEIVEEIVKAMQVNGIWQGELIAKRKDGSNFDVLLSSNIVTDETGNPICMSASFIDITERKEMDERLQKSIQLLNDTGEMAQVGGWELDLSTKEVSLTEETSRIHAVEPGHKLKLEEALDFYAPESRPDVEAAVKRAAETGEPYDLKSLFIPQGSKDKIWIRSIGRAIYSGGKIVKLVGTFQNIDKSNMLEVKLQESLRRFELVLSSIKGGVWEWDILTNHEFFSPQWCEIIGYSFDDPELPHTYNSWVSRIHPDDIARVTSALQNHLEKGTVYDIDYRHRHKSGEYRWQNSRGQAVFGKTGKPIKMVGCISDITERKLAEEALKVSEERFRRLAENALDIIFRYRQQPSLGFDYISPAVLRISGYAPEEFYADPLLIFKVVHPDSHSLLEEITSRPQDYLDKPVVLHWIHKSGELIWTEQRSVPIYDTDGKIIANEGIIRDVTERKRAEEALKTSEENYRNSIDSSPMGVVVFTNEKEILYANQAILDIYGYNSIEELRKTPVKERYTPESYAEYLVRSEKFNSREVTSLGYELTIRRKDGGIRNLQALRKEIIWGGEKLFQLLYMDITERKKAEDEMRESRTRYKELTRLLPLSVWETDENGLLTYTNEETMKIYGYSRQDTAPINYIQNLIPQDRDRAVKNTERLLQGETLDGNEYTALRKDGSTFPSMVYTSAIIRNGKGVGLRGITINTTEQKRAEKRLEQAAQEWRTTFDSITDLVSIHDKDFKLVRVNKAFANAFGASPKELIGKHCYEVVHKTNKPHPNCPHVRTLETMASTTAEFLEPSLGIYLEVATSPLSNNKNEFSGSVHVARDINERKRMQEQLMLANRLSSIGELASGVAHELNNPLTSVIGFSQLLLEKELPDEIREDLSLVNSEAQRAAHVVKNLLTFARKHAPAKQLCQIHNIIEDVLKLRAYEQTVSNITVDIQFAVDLPEITIDYFQMQQVFLNIIVNAEFAMTEAHRKGKITITTQRLDNTVRISFADDGPGIPKENLSRLFDPFFTTKEVGKGTGLGLSICHGIVTEHGGKIYARSQLGKGATFVVELPVTNGH